MVYKKLALLIFGMMAMKANSQTVEVLFASFRFPFMSMTTKLYKKIRKWKKGYCKFWEKESQF